MFSSKGTLLLYLICASYAIYVSGKSIIPDRFDWLDSGDTISSISGDKHGEVPELSVENLLKENKLQPTLKKLLIQVRKNQNVPLLHAENGLVEGNRQLHNLSRIIICTKDGRCQICRQCKPEYVTETPCTSSRDIICRSFDNTPMLSLCIDLFKRNDIQNLLKTYWTESETFQHPHLLHNCLNYFAGQSLDGSLWFSEDILEIERNARTFHKRDMGSVQEKGSNQSVIITTSTSVTSTPNMEWLSIATNTTETSASSSTAGWVYYIAIGVAALVLFVALIALFICHRRIRSFYQKSPRRHPGTIRCVLKGSGVHCHTAGYDEAEQHYQMKCNIYSPTDIVLMQDISPAAELNNYDVCDDVFERSDLSSSYTQQSDRNKLPGDIFTYSDRCRYVSMDYISVSKASVSDDSETHKIDYENVTCSDTRERNDCRPSFKKLQSLAHKPLGIRGDSNYRLQDCYERNASSLTRSYISIPPTSPSENYIEAGADSMFVRSGHSTLPAKTAWLTKNLKIDTRNELGNYQASFGTQTESDIDVTSPKCNTVFGTPWQFGGTFTSHGGILQAKNSDVCFVVSTNAVEKADYVDIYGAVFTDTIEIRKKFDFPATESLITPVVEYHAVPSSHFNRHLCVQLPHALPEESDVSLIKVYTFTVDDLGKVSLHTVPMSSKANDDRSLEVYWEKGIDGCSIHISTTHFSGYFCTWCGTTSLPSICTMVFGSHVQITPSRREVRVILYIWDRRLTIKDYLERFCQQESDVDRQLLTSMQVPLLNDASSESRLVMKMDVMGEDLQSWRHVSKPDWSRPLFKPLQVRKLHEIVHCCRQTDPIRVEWALENAPRHIPSTIFQCCIDILHVDEYTSDYENVMREGSDELRTHYVRDLKVMAYSSQELQPNTDILLVDLKKVLLEVTNVPQTEKICQKFGIAAKDIGNFKKKYTTVEAFQEGLVDECLNRHGLEKFVTLLPNVLERLNLIHVLTALEDKKVLFRNGNNLLEHQKHALEPVQSKVAAHSPKPSECLAVDEDNTLCKRLFSSSQRDNASADARIWKNCKENQMVDLQPQILVKSDEVFVPYHTLNQNPLSDNHGNRNVDNGVQMKQPLILPNSRYGSLLHEHAEDCKDNNTNDKVITNNRLRCIKQNDQEIQEEKNQKLSSSKYDSVLNSSSLLSADTMTTSEHSATFPTSDTSLAVCVDPLDITEPYSEDFLDELQQTYKKELVLQRNDFGPQSTENASYICNGQLSLSNSGPHAMPPQSGKGNFASDFNHLLPYQVSHKVTNHENSQAQDKNQTRKKELYDVLAVA